MTWWRLTGHPVNGVDLAVLRSGGSLARSGEMVWVSVAAGACAGLRRDLALVGIGLSEGRPPEMPRDLVLAIATDLRPAGWVALETLELERLPLERATRAVLGRPILRRISPRYRDPRRRSCRELLRGHDELAWWERRAWLPRDAFRQVSVRRTFRPVLFDQGAVDGRRRCGLLRASDGAITRWAFA